MSEYIDIITEEKRTRFESACSKVIFSAREENGIGTLSEKTLHAVLKNYLEPDATCHEIKTGKYFADIHTSEGIIEIQTKQFNRLRDKLEAFLPNNKVTVVYPIAYEKILRWVDDTTGEISKGRKSGKKGTPQRVFYELYKIKPYLNHPNFHLLVIMLNTEEYRFLNGWSKDRKKGSSCSDRIPTMLVEEWAINSIEDYKKLLPDKLPEKFTVKDFAAAAKLTPSGAQPAVNVLHHLGVIQRIEKKGNAYIYRIADSPLF